MDFRRLDRGELIAVAGGILLGASLFLAWYRLGNPTRCSTTATDPTASCTGWAALTILRVLLLIAAAAPLILAWIIVRGHALSLAPRRADRRHGAGGADIHAVSRSDRPAGIAVGRDQHRLRLVDRAVSAAILILVGSVWRSQESAGRRKPPGVL